MTKAPLFKSCVTISLVEQARGGPFVFWDGLADGIEKAADLGFDAVELFLPSSTAVRGDEVQQLLAGTDLSVGAVGTGAGMVIHQLSLTDPDAGRRSAACDFIKSMIDFGGPMGAPAIIGSMQGRHGGDVSREQALGWLGEALTTLGDHARQYDVPLIYEPLNRYETNLANTIGQGVALLHACGAQNVVLLADLFHMNIEEADIAAAIRTGGRQIGHVHYVDSNRQAVGFGHTDFVPITNALKEIDYDGYLCAEAYPIPDSSTAAKMTVAAVDAANQILLK